MTASNGQRKSSDPRKNPREQQGKDSCMSVAAPVLVGIGLLLSRLRPRPTGETRANPQAAAWEPGDGGALWSPTPEVAARRTSPPT